MERREVQKRQKKLFQEGWRVRDRFGVVRESGRGGLGTEKRTSSRLREIRKSSPGIVETGGRAEKV